MHFMIGIVWGIAFALTSRMSPGPFWLRGMLLSIAPWLIMMVVMMPMAGAGFFGLALGMAAPVVTLVLHLVFGAELGAVYGVPYTVSHRHDWRRMPGIGGNAAHGRWRLGMPAAARWIHATRMAR